MTEEDKKILSKIAQAIFDKKGVNILVLDLRGLSTMTDYFVIAEGSVGRHVQSLSSFVKSQLELLGYKHCHIEGTSDGEWIVMDYGSFVIHLLVPEMREKYALEELWTKSKIVDVDIAVSIEHSYPSTKE